MFISFLLNLIAGFVVAVREVAPALQNCAPSGCSCGHWGHYIAAFLVALYFFAVFFRATLFFGMSAIRPCSAWLMASLSGKYTLTSRSITTESGCTW